MPDLNALKHLVAIDRDAITAYSQAIDAIGDEEARAKLTEFRADHERHVTELSQVLRELGDAAPESPHPEGFALAGFTRIAASMTLTHGLMAMESNEIVTSQAYENALEQHLPAVARTIVERNRDDERRHLEAIRALLRKRTPFAAGANAVATMQGAMASTWMNTIRGNVPAMLAIGAAGLLLGGGLIAGLQMRNRAGRPDHARSDHARSGHAR